MNKSPTAHSDFLELAKAFEQAKLLATQQRYARYCGSPHPHSPTPLPSLIPTDASRRTRYRQYHDEHLEWYLKPQKLISPLTKLKIRAALIGFLLCAALYENSMAATGQRPIYRKST